MVNNTVTNTTNGATVELALGMILLLVVVIVIVMDLMVIAALIVDTETVGSISWILGNILAACVIGALGLVLNEFLVRVFTHMHCSHFNNHQYQ